MAIVICKFHGPTNSHGARISAAWDDKKVFVSFDYASPEKGARTAAYKLLTEKIGMNLEIESLTVGEFKGGWIVATDGAMRKL